MVLDTERAMSDDLAARAARLGEQYAVPPPPPLVEPAEPDPEPDGTQVLELGVIGDVPARDPRRWAH